MGASNGHVTDYGTAFCGVWMIAHTVIVYHDHVHISCAYNEHS